VALPRALAVVTKLAPSSDHLALLDVFGTGGRIVERTLPTGSSLNGTVVTSSRSFRSADVRGDARPIVRTIAERNRTRSVLIVPLAARGRPDGTLAVAHRRPGRFGARDQALLEEFASVAALALENTRLREELRRVIHAAGVNPASRPGTLAGTSLRLTRREREIVRLLAADRTGPEIAAALGLSVHTVRHHIERLKRRCGQRTLHGLTSRLLHALVAREWA
jgi:GAF domain-containing protein